MRQSRQQFAWFLACTLPFVSLTNVGAGVRYSNTPHHGKSRRQLGEAESAATTGENIKEKTTTITHYNALGEALQPCSQSGMARTGPSGGSGQCIMSDSSDSRYSDTSETICIDMTSLVFGDYCKVVGATTSSSSSSSAATTTSSNNNVQGDAGDYNMEHSDVTRDPWWWCSSEDDELPCQDGGETSGTYSSVSDAPSPSPSTSSSDDEKCPMKNWCVTPESFAKYVHKAGCLAIGNIVCESLNREALRAYEVGSTQYSDALDCLIDRCGLFLVYSSSRNGMSAGFGNPWVDVAGFAAITIGIAMGALIVLQLSSREPAFEEPLTDECELEQEGEPS